MPCGLLDITGILLNNEPASQLVHASLELGDIRCWCGILTIVEISQTLDPTSAVRGDVCERHLIWSRLPARNPHLNNLMCKELHLAHGKARAEWPTERLIFCEIPC